MFVVSLSRHIRAVTMEKEMKRWPRAGGPVHEPRCTTGADAHHRLKIEDWLKNGAGDEIRTHDPNLGKVVLYP